MVVEIIQNYPETTEICSKRNNSGSGLKAVYDKGSRWVGGDEEERERQGER